MKSLLIFVSIILLLFCIFQNRNEIFGQMDKFVCEIVANKKEYCNAIFYKNTNEKLDYSIITKIFDFI
jgi:hypothetical protein